jgi:outer membrane lipoprotein-sorting protein
MLVTVSIYSQQDKDKLFEKIKLQYSELQSVSLNFTLNDNSAVKGQLLAKKGNKYILSLGNRKIYCDGKNIWNYIPTNKNVIISSFEEHGESVSIEKIFFQFTNSYKPAKLYKNQSSNSESSSILELVPKNESENEITMIKLNINPNTLDIHNVILVRNYNEESWAISNLKLNPSTADNKFIFNIPEKVETIDLR